MKKFALYLLSLTLLLLPSCSKGTDNPVITIGAHTFGKAFYEYLYHNYQREMPDANEQEISERVLVALKDAAAVYTIAEQYKIKSDVKPSDAYNAMLELDFNGNKNALESALSEAHMDRKLFEETYALQALEEAVYLYLTDEANGIIHASDEILLEDIQTNFFHATHILILFDNHASKDECRTIAEDALKRAKSGEDFQKLIAELGEDERLLSQPDNYYFTHNEFEITEFEETVKKMSIGEISEIVESPYGYHIIKRLPLVNEEINRNIESLRNSFCTRKYYEYKGNLASTLSVTYENGFETFTDR